MKIIDINNGFFYELSSMITEANVVNVKVDFDGNSITKYVNHYAENLGSQEVKQIFAKKIAKLLVNDERFLYAVRNLPDNAPEWTKEAMQKGELVYFKPSAELDQSMEHLTHYMSALEQDSQNTENRDAMVYAQRELAGFSKAENLDILIKKSNEYFKRGSKKAGRSEEGMKEILDVGNGFVWYLLTSADAYRREGKTLQNCIGAIWTRDKAKKDGKEIVVLRKANGESIVAARIDNNSHTIEEMKGKNNQPPVDKYMLPVIQFVNKMKLGLSGYAEHDFRKGGYFFIEGKLYPRAEVIKRFVSKEVIDKLPNGHTLVQINAGNQMIAGELFGDVYPEFKNYFWRSVSDGARVTIYELRSNDKPLITGLVRGKTLIEIHRHSGGVEMTESLIREALDIKEKIGREFISMLMRKKLIDEVSPKMQRALFWSERLKLKPETGEFEPSIPSGKVETGKEHLKWEQYTDKADTTQIRNALGSENEYRKTGIDNISPKDVKSVFIAKTEAELSYSHFNQKRQPVNLAIIKTKNNVLVPAVVTSSGSELNVTNIGAIGSPYTFPKKRHTEIVNSTIALANKEHADLTKSFRVTNGIIKDGDTYKVFEPKKEQLSGEPSGVKIDLSSVDIEDRFSAIDRVLTAGGIRKRENDSETNIHENDIDLADRIEAAVTGEKFRRTNYYMKRHIIDDTSDWNGKEIRDVFKIVFGGATPDAIYLVDVNYGKDRTHEVCLIADRKTVIFVDGTTAKHEFQKWEDYDKVAEQLTAFAKQHGLVYEKTALGRVKELRVYQGEIRSASQVQKSRLQGMKKVGKVGLEGTDELDYADNSKLIRMSPEEQAEWARKGLHSDTVPGEGWKLVDANGDPKAIFLVKDNTVQSVYAKIPRLRRGTTSGNTPSASKLDNITQKQLNKNDLKYLKTAMDQFNWGVKNSAQFVLKPESRQHNILKNLKRQPNGMQRGELYRSLGVLTPSGWDRPNSVDRHLAELGFIKRESVGNRNTIKLKITPTGIAALRLLNDDKPVNVAGVAGAEKVSPTWEKPERKAPPSRAQRAGGNVTGRTKAGSKAEQALQRFQEYAEEHDRIPTRSEFMQILQAEPFNMSRAGAQTYYYTTKAKYAALNEKFSEQAFTELLAETASLRLDTGSFGALRTLLIS